MVIRKQLNLQVQIMSSTNCIYFIYTEFECITTISLLTSAKDLILNNMLCCINTSAKQCITLHIHISNKRQLRIIIILSISLITYNWAGYSTCTRTENTYESSSTLKLTQEQEPQPELPRQPDT